MKNSSHPNSIWKKIKSMGGLILLWNLVVALGGIVLLMFVVSNGFLPELNLYEAVSLLASTSFIALFLIFCVAMLTFAGGGVLYILFNEWDANERGRISALSAFLSASVIYAVLTVPGKAPLLVQWASFAILVTIITICVIAAVRAYNTNSYFRYQESGKKFCILVVSLFVGLLFGLFNTMAFTQIYLPRLGAGGIEQWAMMGLWLLVQAACIGMVSSSWTLVTFFKISGTAGAVGCFFFILLSNNPTFIVRRTAQILGIGALPNVSLAVTREGCRILSVLSTGELCTLISDKEVYVVGPVTLRSRFGKQVQIEYVATGHVFANSGKTTYRAVLQAADVLGWQQKTILEGLANED